MGIPGYTRWLRQRFSGAFHPVVPSKPLGLQCPRANRLGFDHVHFDLAARLYMVSGRANDTAHLVRLLLRDLHRVVRWTSPRQSVTLAVDGVPPAAKLWTQRIRRFDRKRATSSSSHGVDTLGFTLGTLVMRQVGLALSFFAVQALQAHDFAHTVFYVSGPEVVGEGEHKLHARVLSLLGSRPSESHLIIGNDADLIVQACAAAAVVEQRQAALPPRSRLLPGVATAIGGGPTSIDQLTLLLTYRGHNQLLLPMSELAAAVLSELPEPARHSEGVAASASRTLLDLSLLSLLMGSDYLPRPKGLKLASTYPACAVTCPLYSDLLAICLAAGLQMACELTNKVGCFVSGTCTVQACTQPAPRVRFHVDHRALARLIELVLERHKRSPERSRQGSDDRDSTGLVAIDTMGAEEYLSALLWTLELTGNAASSQPRRSFLPSHAPTAKDLAVYLNECAVQDELLQQSTVTHKEEPKKKTTPSQSQENSLAPINAYTVGLSTLPLHRAEKLLPVYLAPLVSELSSEAQAEVRHRCRAQGDGAGVIGSERTTNRLIAWLQSSWLGTMVGARISAGNFQQGTSRTATSHVVSSEWLPPEAAFPCVDRVDAAVVELGKIADAKRERLDQSQAVPNETGDNQNVASLTKKQRVQRKRSRSHRAWLYPEDEDLAADKFWRQTNGAAVYFSRQERAYQPKRRGQRHEDEGAPTNGCPAAAAARGGLGKPVTTSDLPAPRGCEPLYRLHNPVVALTETIMTSRA